MRRVWSRGNSYVIKYETLAMAQPNKMQERYVRALDLSPGFSELSII
jgi:hypothetical protein